jgi:superfamily II DNA/RNA helicase
VFFKTIDSCVALFHRLRSKGYDITLLHAALPAAVRAENFSRYSSGQCDLLFATDVASRGLDIPVDVVINFDMPTESLTYLSRAGRVGRMGRVGVVYNIFTKHQAVITKAIKAFLKHDIPLHQLSNDRRHMGTPRYGEWRAQKKNALARSYVSLITRKAIPAHLERTYVRHNALWRPLFRPKTISAHAGVPPLQQQKIMDHVMRDAVEYRKQKIAKVKGGKAKFGSRTRGVWNYKGGAFSNRVANYHQDAEPASGPDFGIPRGPPK